MINKEHVKRMVQMRIENTNDSIARIQNINLDAIPVNELDKLSDLLDEINSKAYIAFCHIAEYVNK